MGNKRDSILQAAVPDLGAPRLEYVLVAFTDCDPPEWALGLYVNGVAQGFALDGAQRIITSRSMGVLRHEAAARGIPPHEGSIPGVTTR